MELEQSLSKGKGKRLEWGSGAAVCMALSYANNSNNLPFTIYLATNGVQMAPGAQGQDCSTTRSALV